MLKKVEFIIVPVLNPDGYEVDYHYLVVLYLSLSLEAVAVHVPHVSVLEEKCR